MPTDQSIVVPARPEYDPPPDSQEVCARCGTLLIPFELRTRLRWVTWETDERTEHESACPDPRILADDLRAFADVLAGTGSVRRSKEMARRE